MRMQGRPCREEARSNLPHAIVDGLQVDGKDAIFWDRELAGFGIRIYPTGGKVYVA